jgi:hypothetical protein
VSGGRDVRCGHTEERGRLCARQTTGNHGQKQQRPSSGMAVCTPHDPNVDSADWTGGLPARLTGRTARFTRLGFIDR